MRGEVCVVTGGGRGIGKAIVERLLAEGALVHAVDLSDEGPADGAIRHRCDVSRLAETEALARAIGPVDVLVNNAATVTKVGPITELDPEEWSRTIAVNVTGLFNMSRSMLPAMGKGGRIINLASTFGHVGSPGRVAYSTSKGAVLAFTRCLALDVAPLGIRVNSVSPGGIATERLIELFGSQEKADDYLAPLHPLGHTGRGQDVAEAVAFLASGASRFVTGTDLLVDGGYTAQ